MISETRQAVLVKVKGVFFFHTPKRDYSIFPSTKGGNVENEPERMFAGAAVIMSRAFILAGEKKS